ncbi:hypothetical protein [Segatella copri]|uniref:Uncharacterized protein n=1 Tax=Segatella copri TaxID=165179 RepID=A0AAW9TDL6_9BACT|nr:hypothetical protein [Segatella copri]MQN26889.1 hypothetical protein [Segatella copri]MQN32053.1 hypothetical protein [Segatella copri]MQN38438.1 hypothetical protein [Segatella copri]MQN75883.1 hypothetical protein [Segatella copri]MQO27157.1 hypothetical protein [Segatella copri]
MRTTIKSMAMVAIALFAGFGTASAQEESADEGVELTKDMFHIWDGLTQDAQPTDEHVYMDWTVGAENPNDPGSVIVGTSTVSENIYADLSDYHYMVVYGEGTNPRFMFNRTVANGQQADGGMIAIENKAFDEKTGAIVLDLKKDLVRTVPGEDPTVDDFAHLVTIKAPWGGPCLISLIKLYNTLPEELGGGATGIKNVNVANDAVVATFNAAGAKVAANAKGLVIKKFQSGKVVKVMNK